ncbi:MAG: hypothetical protein A2474_03080 [Elusimicrobia bacterium RIFOXYC2_FULL_34_12]|nr:MAG: hypothetical protein A2474_03080 [Elusimicrobia bacterium RIFOXYC2_FULL_34_12]OGS38827.1 MAG: hypothetical protein A2551_03010 [Elusimicrobia bacterium RIFOXYD2_FULL_34_30]
MFIIVFFITFGIYLYTLYSTIQSFRDAGDLIVSAYTLGIAHPPGYPLYVILGKIWTTLIPLGNIAYRTNIFSAITSALCVTIVYLIVSKKLESKWIGAITAFSLAISTAFWRQSILSEIYSLNALFAIIVIYILLFHTDKLLLLSFLFGLGLGNHQTLLLLVPGIAYFLIKSKYYITNIKTIKYLMIFFLLGFSIYLFLPIRASRQPINNWGNPSNFSNFVKVLSRADYGTMNLSSRYSGTNSSLLDSFKIYLSLLKNNIGVIGILLLFIGITVSFKNTFNLTILLLFLFTGPFFIFLSRLPNNEFSLAMLEPACALPSIFLVILIGICIKKMIPKSIVPLFILFPLFLGITNFNKLNKRNNFLALDYGKNLMLSIGKNSFLSMIADMPIFTINYLQYAGKYRNDIKIVYNSFLPWRIREYENKYPDLFLKEHCSSTIDCLLKNSSKYPVFTEGVHSGLENYVVPTGVACRLLANENIESKAQKVKETIHLYDLYRFRKSNDILDYYEKQVISYYSSAFFNASVILQQGGLIKEAEIIAEQSKQF